ncbi:DNA ligase [Paenibacillus aurantiacus]|uniref:DNA ligase n=1 Tax=Paenibacillus aurantiacus TaxID=1936118 RepID=A0ABV5KUE0_9BACL
MEGAWQNEVPAQWGGDSAPLPLFDLSAQAVDITEQVPAASRPDLLDSPAPAADIPSAHPGSPLAVEPIPLPFDPMAPIADNEIPSGDDWCYQLKWDGVRILARVGTDGNVELYSRSMFLKNPIYPEIVRLLTRKAAELGPCLLDGEIVWWNGVRPNFQQVLKRERSRGTSIGSANARSPYSRHEPVIAHTETDAPTGSNGAIVFVLFDLLADGKEDLRTLPYEERYRRLNAKFPTKEPQLFVTDTFADGEALWRWVEANQWEGVVSKRWSSPYREGKKHRDWLKKRTAVLLDVDIVGLKWRSGIIASLVMAYDGAYLGSVSSGLNEPLRKVLMSTFRPIDAHVPARPCPFAAMPGDLKREEVQWLQLPFRCRVSGLEITSAGQLRHPKLVTFLPKDTLP